METKQNVELVRHPAQKHRLIARPVIASLALAATAMSRSGEAADSQINSNAVRPFRVSVSKEQLTDLRRRIKSTKWPTRELVPDASQGVQLATIQKLSKYWASEYDWRKVEAKLNALPNFITEIDGLDIHFIHVRSNHE